MSVFYNHTTAPMAFLVVFEVVRLSPDLSLKRSLRQYLKEGTTTIDTALGENSSAMNVF